MVFLLGPVSGSLNFPLTNLDQFVRNQLLFGSSDLLVVILLLLLLVLELLLLLCILLLFFQLGLLLGSSLLVPQLLELFVREVSWRGRVRRADLQTKAKRQTF